MGKGNEDTKLLFGIRSDEGSDTVEICGDIDSEEDVKKLCAGLSEFGQQGMKELAVLAVAAENAIAKKFGKSNGGILSKLFVDSIMDTLETKDEKRASKKEKKVIDTGKGIKITVEED